MFLALRVAANAVSVETEYHIHGCSHYPVRAFLQSLHTSALWPPRQTGERQHDCHAKPSQPLDLCIIDDHHIEACPLEELA